MLPIPPFWEIFNNHHAHNVIIIYKHVYWKETWALIPACHTTRSPFSTKIPLNMHLVTTRVFQCRQLCVSLATCLLLRCSSSLEGKMMAIMTQQSWLEIKHYSVAYFDCVTVFKVWCTTTVKGRAHTHCIDTWIFDISIQHAGALPLVEVLWYVLLSIFYFINCPILSINMCMWSLAPSTYRCFTCGIWDRTQM